MIPYPVYQAESGRQFWLLCHDFSFSLALENMRQVPDVKNKNVSLISITRNLIVHMPCWTFQSEEYPEL